MKNNFLLTFSGLVVTAASLSAAQPEDHLVFEGASGPGVGKHVVFLAGDEEYRSEEAMPMMAEVLSKQGFKCTVLFSLDENGKVDPNAQGSLANSKAIDSADSLVMSLRFRNWDDESMERFNKAIERGVSVVGLRTSTHAFNFKNSDKWAKFSFRAKGSTGWQGGFGRQILGETWVSHHGKHKVEGTRTHAVKGAESHPVLNGVGSIFGTTDVYGATPLSDGTTLLLNGEVTKSLNPKSEGVKEKNSPMQPVAWVRELTAKNGSPQRVFTTTLGAATDLLDENLRRLVVNGIYWGLDLPVPKNADVSIKGEYNPAPYSFNTFRAGLKPADFVVGGKAHSMKPPVAVKKKKATKKKVTAKQPTKKTAKSAKAKPGAKKLPPGVVPPVSWETTEYKKGNSPKVLSIGKGDSIAFVGGGLGSRMAKFNHFETELYLRHADADMKIRNMCDEGNTPGHRQHPGRSFNDQFAYPGAKELVNPELQRLGGKGHFETADQWLARHRADIVIGFFGFSSSFYGADDLERYKKELAGFIKHTLSQKYNNETVPQLALVTPTAFQNLSEKYGTPTGEKQNANLALYSAAMKEVAAEHGVLCVDAYTATKGLFEDKSTEYTTDGALLSDEGYRWLAPFLVDSVFGKSEADESKRKAIHSAVGEKNWVWMNDYKIPNGVHVYGSRYNPHGPKNYPDEIKKTREMTEVRDQAIWAALKGKKFDLAAADAQTHPLSEVETNYGTLDKKGKKNSKNGTKDYKTGKESQTKIALAEGYKMELFASEKDFPNLANPCQMAFDNKGRLWVSTMASYPHYRIGDPRPQDCLLILEDTDNDGKADKETVFANDLHIPIGFEITEHGVFVSQSDSLVLLKDTDGDDKYDVKEVILSGFDDHDTHHAISAFCADPSGAIVMGEGTFLRSGVETAYGTVLGSNGGFFRYSPQRKKLDRYAQYGIPNPWGIAYDDYGQDFFLHTSGPSLSWMLPGSLKTRYGANMEAPTILTGGGVRPTSGLEFISSRHFPDDVQGDVLINNSIGYLGAKQHKVIEGDTGFLTEPRQDLFFSEDRNFRPVDLEFAPDGSLYVVDWHNVLIGHMQHNARDPLRDHVHGRIYRVTYPSRPLVEPADIDGAEISTLLENLKLPEYRSRYRTRRELRGRDASEVVAAAVKWAAKQTEEHPKLEALWVTWGANQVDENLLRELLKAKDHRVRAAAVRVLRFSGHNIKDQASLLSDMAADIHGRVRLEVINAASFLEKNVGLAIVEKAKAGGLEGAFKDSYQFAVDVLNGRKHVPVKKKFKAPGYVHRDFRSSYSRGGEIYNEESYCGTCHQPDGKGLPDVGFPPLAKTKWVNGSSERLIKITLNGLMGPIEVNGKKYPGHVPMTGFGGILNDQEIADVLTYVRNSFGNKSQPINALEVKRVRASMKGNTGFLKPSELLKEHPHK